VLEVPEIIPEIHVVRNADKAAQLQLVHPGFLLNFPHGANLNVFPGFLMALGEVPEAVSRDEQEISPAVTHQASGGIHFPEFGTNPPVALLNVRGGDVNAGQSVLHFEHPYQRPDVHLLSHVELYGVRIGQGFLVGGTNNDATLLEINFVHDFC
jgi:hypothetical protein